MQSLRTCTHANHNKRGPGSFSDISTEWLELNEEKQHGNKPYDTKAIFEAVHNTKAIFEAALDTKAIFEAIQTVFAE